MKKNLKRAALLLTGSLLGGSVFAQSHDSTARANYVKPFSSIDAYRTWSIGVGVGVMTPFTPFKGNVEDYTYHGTDLGYSAYIKDQLLPSFGLQLSYMGGKISGSAAQNPAFSSYSTSFHYGIDLSGNFTLANISWRNQQNAVQPYITAGFGLAGYVPSFVANGQSITVDHTVKNAYI